jgi:hypothetical protein
LRLVTASVTLGHVKEAHLRLDFPVGDGTYMDKVGYGLLRIDWETQSTTPIVDEPLPAGSPEDSARPENQ